jgi:hypothetical protein
MSGFKPCSIVTSAQRKLRLLFPRSLLSIGLVAATLVLPAHAKAAATD